MYLKHCVYKEAVYVYIREQCVVCVLGSSMCIRKQCV